MKKVGVILILNLLICSSLISQDIYYTINIGTFLEAKTEDFANLKDIGFLHSQKLEANLSQIYLGGYASTEQARADLNKVRAAGYTNAYLQENFLSNGQEVPVVQISTMRPNTPINWARFSEAGDLYVLLENGLVKIVVGGFQDLNQVRQSVSSIRQKGFKDAFIKNVNSVRLHSVGAFESGNSIKKPLIPIQLEENGQIVTTTNNGIPTGYDIDPGATNPPNTNPNTDWTRKSPPTTNTNARPSAPEIRGNIKRKSAVDLQKILQNAGVYSAGVDGYYGPGTKRAYDNYARQDRTFQKYQILARYAQDPLAGGGGDRLQRAINDLPNNANAINGYPHYIAKVYQAYVNFSQRGPSNRVNNLMNGAIQEAFSNSGSSQVIGFDPSATYAYNDLGQLLLHLFIVHGAADNDYTIPCWIVERHPQEYNVINTNYSAMSGISKLQRCQGFESWSDVSLLKTIAEEFQSNDMDPVNLSKSLTLASRLYYAPSALSRQMGTEVEQWNIALWQNADRWANQDPIHQRMVTALKVAYLQTQVRMEDYYMNQGLKDKEARSLALATLRALVGTQLQRFTT